MDAGKTMMGDTMLSGEPMPPRDLALLAEFASEQDPHATLENAIANLLAHALLRRAQRIYGTKVSHEERFLNGALAMGNLLAGRMCQVLDEATEPQEWHIDELARDIVVLGVRTTRQFQSERAAATAIDAACAANADGIAK